MNESTWAKSICQRLNDAWTVGGKKFPKLKVICGEKLPYRHEVFRYQIDKPVEPKTTSYETDLLVIDVESNNQWTPRVVIECKLGSITTHDALTYSAKAETHKQVHPYLRYGILIGKQRAIPGRLFRHGAYFDFMATWSGEEAAEREWRTMLALVKQEVHASRNIEEFLRQSRMASKREYKTIQRRLIFEA